MKIKSSNMTAKRRYNCRTNVRANAINSQRFTGNYSLYETPTLVRSTVQSISIVVTSENKQAIPSILYQAGPITSEFGKRRSTKRCRKMIMKPAQTKWVAVIVFAPKKKRSICMLLRCLEKNRRIHPAKLISHTLNC